VSLGGWCNQTVFYQRERLEPMWIQPPPQNGRAQQRKTGYAADVHANARKSLVQPKRSLPVLRTSSCGAAWLPAFCWDALDGRRPALASGDGYRCPRPGFSRRGRRRRPQPGVVVRINTSCVPMFRVLSGLLTHSAGCVTGSGPLLREAVVIS